MASKGCTKVIYKRTFVSKQSLFNNSNVFHLQTDRNGIHETGHWGFCDKGEGTCPMPEIDKLLTEVGKSQFIGTLHTGQN